MQVGVGAHGLWSSPSLPAMKQLAASSLRMFAGSSAAVVGQSPRANTAMRLMVVGLVAGGDSEW